VRALWKHCAARCCSSKLTASGNFFNPHIKYTHYGVGSTCLLNLLQSTGSLYKITGNIRTHMSRFDSFR